MFKTDDTIVAIATPPGRGGIGVVRLSGPAALAIGHQLITRKRALQPRRATFSHLSAAGSAGTRDHVVVTSFPAPASYTGEDVLELSAHGSPVVLRAVVEGAVSRGARLAEPGEFTLRAFLHGRLDLPQAEAVADLVDAVTPLQARAAFDQLQGTLTQAIGEIDRSLFDLIARLEASVDFPDEGYHFTDAARVAAEIDTIASRTAALIAAAERGRLVREGLTVAIVGAPNAGKSSLFNALVGAPRAIVAETAGTTRDLVSETIDLEGLRVTLVDTAGLRDGRSASGRASSLRAAVDPVEIEGMTRTRGAARVADLVLCVADGSRPRGQVSDPLGMGESGSVASGDAWPPVVSVRTKCDLPAAWHDAGAVPVSARTGENIDGLRHAIAAALHLDTGNPQNDVPTLTNIRHLDLVRRADRALRRASHAARGEGSSGTPLSEEFVLADLQDARVALEEVVGRRAPEALLEHIFARFCIGK